MKKINKKFAFTKILKFFSKFLLISIFIYTKNYI